MIAQQGLHQWGIAYIQQEYYLHLIFQSSPYCKIYTQLSLLYLPSLHYLTYNQRGMQRMCL
jgi:hypothetical protein